MNKILLKGGRNMGKNRYIYPAIFDYAEDGISVEFPDLLGCLTFGGTNEEALAMAKEAMAHHLYGMEEDSVSIPAPSKATDIKTESNQVVDFVEVWMPPFRNATYNS